VGDKIFVEDVRFYARHGVTNAEHALGAWFSVDVELATDLTPAATTDDLASTIDYGFVARRVAEIGTGDRVNLLERLAGRIAEALLRELPASEIRVRVRKLTAPLAGVTGTPGVELTRARGSW
jgi:dihydroneopterin aldolase